ncbi:protein-L-isoaspartate(D-aspartate) O-methyltransferase [Constrictibacter sp. MBR-5]|jgi:protein-L-isoaspartate(D-aspartate) O-methyltransferase|uniref:protein-L-isoaspartate O-methyltransferase family protein n=1 Tax=Constrictibacter sp. MBR-5 TaxID=3156467 RepID=UPI003398839E
MTDYAAARLNMVESQIRANNVTDPPVVDAFMSVPREMFVPKTMRGVAYVDEDLSLGDGRYLIEPMVLARLVQLGQVGPEDLVLDVGSATGYSTAVLARLAAAVVGVEADEQMVQAATANLGQLGIDNAVFVRGPLEAGYAKQAPYNVIIFQGAIDEVPPAIADQLAEGGRLVAVVRQPRGMGLGTLFMREHGTLSGRAAFDAATPLLPGFARKPAFVF